MIPELKCNVTREELAKALKDVLHEVERNGIHYKICTDDKMLSTAVYQLILHCRKIEREKASVVA